MRVSYGDDEHDQQRDREPVAAAERRRRRRSRRAAPGSANIRSTQRMIDGVDRAAAVAGDQAERVADQHRAERDQERPDDARCARPRSRARRCRGRASSVPSQMLRGSGAASASSRSCAFGSCGAISDAEDRAERRRPRRRRSTARSGRDAPRGGASRPTRQLRGGGSMTRRSRRAPPEAGCAGRANR